MGISKKVLFCTDLFPSTLCIKFQQKTKKAGGGGVVRPLRPPLSYAPAQTPLLFYLFTRLSIRLCIYYYAIGYRREVGYLFTRPHSHLQVSLRACGTLDHRD